MHIDQVLVGAAPGDAVTESALRIRDALRGAVDADVYALHVDERLRDYVGRLGDYPIPENRSADDVIIFHASIGDARVFDFVMHRGERVFAVYHNITPPSFFRAFNPGFADLLDEGRQFLPELLRKAEAVFADSVFNARELMALGRTDVIVCPPPLRLHRLLEVEPDPVLRAQFPVSAPGAMMLFVGQLMPHKRPDFAIGAHHLLVANARSDARLVLAGTGRYQQYSRAVRALIDETNLDTVWMTGEISDAQLAAFYRRADVFVTASEHEGFFVPLIEAFNFGVPVVARGFGAIPETAGDAAIVLAPDDPPAVMAEAVDRVLRDLDLRAELISRGHRRAQQFETDAVLAHMLREIHVAVARSRVSV